MRSLPAGLALLLAFSPASAQSVFDFPRAEKALNQDLDPRYAADFLKDIAAQRANQIQDPEREARLVERAAALKDMSDLLTDYADPASMTEALLLRLGGDGADPGDALLRDFNEHSDKLLAWRAEYFNDVPAGRVETALLTWKTLTPQQHDWLAASPRSFTEEKWEAASFARRASSLHEWASAIYDRLMKVSPKTAADLALLRSARFEIWGVLDHDQKRLSGEYMTKAAAAVEGLQLIGSLPRVRESTDPAMKDLLAKARAGASLQDTLAALAALFDKAGVRDETVQAFAPGRPDQELSSLDPRVLGGMLGEGLRAEVGDVDVGRSVVQFFETHPLKIEVRDLDTALARFEPGTDALVFNERFITNWIKSQGLSAQAVVSNPARFHELVMMLAPEFVHESTHRIQKADADTRGIYAWTAQHQEIEAEEVESDYMIEKEAKSPAYRRFLRRTREHSYYVQQDLTRTEEFVRDPRKFHADIMNDIYANLPSLEIAETNALLRLDADSDALRDEKRRRAALSPTARAKIARTGLDQDKYFESMTDWKTYLMKVKIGAIDDLIADNLREREKVIKTYELASARTAKVLDRAEKDARNILGSNPTIKNEVPPPGGSQ